MTGFASQFAVHEAVDETEWEKKNGAIHSSFGVRPLYSVTKRKNKFILAVIVQPKT